MLYNFGLMAEIRKDMSDCVDSIMVNIDGIMDSVEGNMEDVIEGYK